MILTQAVMFVLPAVTLGFIMSTALLKFIFEHFATSKDLDINFSCYPSQYAAIQALNIGVLIPLLSSIIPIIRILSGSLTEALNIDRAKTTGTIIIATGNAKKQNNNILPYLLFGLSSVAFGLTVYYFLPLSLL